MDDDELLMYFCSFDGDSWALNDKHDLLSFFTFIHFVDAFIESEEYSKRFVIKRQINGRSAHNRFRHSIE